MSTFWPRVMNAALDKAFGPIHETRADPTLFFQQTILTILPTSLLALLTPLYLLYYNAQPIVSTEMPLLWTKLVASAVVFILHVVIAVLDISPDDSTNAAKAAALLGCAAPLAIGVLLYYEHRRALQSSALSSIYLAATVLFDIVKTRSCFLRDGATLMGSIYAAITAAQLFLLILEEAPKRYHIPASAFGKEAVRGFWSRTFFVWVNTTLFLGFRNALSVDQLPNLGPGFASRVLAETFEKKWIKSKIASLRLMKLTIWSLPGSFLAVVPARLLYITFSFMHPFLISRILQYIEEEENDDEIRNGLIGATALTYVGVAVSRACYMHMNNRFVTKARGLLVSQMMQKNLLLCQEEAAKSAAVTLMSTDVEGIASALPSIHGAWASVVELSVGVYLLSTIVKEASFLVMLPAIISSVLSVQLGRLSRPAMRNWNDRVQDRVAKTSQILAQLKGIKMMATETTISDFVQNLREAEITVSKAARKVTVWTYVAAPLGYTFTPIIVIAGGLFWVGFEDFNAKVAFTSLAFISLASKPIMTILTSWSRVGGLAACFERIEKHLLLKDRQDYRGRAQCAHAGGSSNDIELAHLLDEFPIQMIDACISPIADKPPKLWANFSLAKGTTNMMIGPTACGKSTLLKAVLGEANLMKGSVNVQPGRIAYCSQDPWLCNISIRKNIIGQLAYDENWYNRVINICQLRDIFDLTDGDMSLAGSRGSNLSRGQRQRISLARAIYSHAPIMVLDNVLSSIDRETASAILEGLMGADGLLRQVGVTVLMTTHILDDLSYADHVLAVSNEGKVTMSKSKQAIKKYASMDYLNQNSDDSASNGDGRHGNAATQNSLPMERRQEEASTRLRQQGDMSLYKFYLSSVTVWLVLVWLVLTMLVAITEKFPDIFVRIWMDLDPDNRVYFACYATLAVVYLLCLGIWTWTYLLHLVPESSETLHKSLLDSVMGATMSFLTYTDSGAILNRFSQDMSLVSQALPRAFMFFLYTLFGVVADLVITLSASPYATILFPFIFVLLYVLQHYYLRTSRQMRILDLEAKTPLYTHFVETSDGLHHIRAFGWEDETLTSGHDLLDHSQKPFYYMYCIQRWLSLVLDLTVAGIAVVLVAVALNLNSTNQSALGLALLYAMKLGTQLAYLLNEWVDLETSLGALFRLRGFSEETPKEDARVVPNRQNDQAAQVSDSWPENGAIKLDGVTASYAKADGSKHTAVDNVTINISGGSKVAIVGRTGSGKTSLLMTLLNFLEYTGTVKIDGIEVSSIPRAVLRSRITSISQDLINLPCSVRDNLSPCDMNKAPEDCPSDECMFQALAKVWLESHIKAHGALDGPLGDASLSQGQKQLLALARALIQVSRTKSKIVLVDEATNEIDVECEEKMQAVMDDAFQDCTVLTVAHRLHTMNAAGIRLEMSHGRLTMEEKDDE